MMMRTFRAAAVAAVSLVAATPALAEVIFDRTAASYDTVALSDTFTKENACGCGPAESAALVDSFTLTGSYQLTSVKAALVAIQQNEVSTFTGFQNAIGYQVNIYSSAAAAATNLAGDVYSFTVSPGTIGFGAGFAVTDPDAQPFIVGSSLATLNIDKVLGAGTYWLSVIGIDNPDDNESIGVALQGTGLATFTNPGGGFGIPGNAFPTGLNGGYALAGAAGVPEPATWALLLLGFGGMGIALRRVRRPVTAHA